MKLAVQMANTLKVLANQITDFRAREKLARTLI